jgi:DNA-directed RNA polymerase subunit RPC12/RpoP
MANKAIIQEEIVNAADIDPNSIRCPRCKGDTLILKGNSQIAREEVMEKGEIISVNTNADSHAFELEVIECMPCDRRFIIKTREVFQLEQSNESLRQLVIEATGKDPYGLGRPN